MGVFEVAGDWHVMVISKARVLLACSVPSRNREDAEQSQMAAERQVGRGVPNAHFDAQVAVLLVRMMERADDNAVWEEACKIPIATTNKVLLELRKVPPGETISYMELGKRAYGTAAARAAGTAMRTNPFPLIVPCHRVIRTGGALGRYSGAGCEVTKRALLDMEARLRNKKRRAADDE